MKTRETEIYLILLWFTIIEGSVGAEIEINSYNSIGSIQSIIFSGPISANNGAGCDKLFTSESVEHLGNGAVCSLPTSNTLEIKYGHNISSQSLNIFLNPEGFIGGKLTGNFPRPELPKFTLTSSNIGHLYQDNLGTINLTEIITNNAPEENISVEWKYLIYPDESIKPQLSTFKGLSMDFKFWNMTPGEYKIRIRMLDSANEAFYYEQQTDIFVVLNSCSLNCRTVEFLSTEERGLIDKSICATCKDLVNGADPEDSFESCIETPSKISLVYSPGSKGNSELSLKKECFPEGLSARNVNLPPCPAIDYFPQLSQEEYDNRMEYSISHTLEPRVDPEKMHLMHKSAVSWERKQGGSDLDVVIHRNIVGYTLHISPRSLNGKYVLEGRVALTCERETIWDSITYSFYYGSFLSSFDVYGSILYINLTDTVSNNLQGKDCRNYLDPDSAVKAGNMSECSLSGSVISVRFSSTNTLLGETPTLIRALEDGYNVGVYAIAQMSQLPTLSLTSSITQGAVISDTDFPLVINCNVNNIQQGSNSVIWIYWWECDGPSCPDLHDQSTSSLTLYAPQFNSGYQYSIICKVTQSASYVFNLSQTLNFHLLNPIHFLSHSRGINRLRLNAQHKFNISLNCSMLFNENQTQLAKLGAQQGASCTHLNYTNYIYINLPPDSTLTTGDTLTIPQSPYFDEYNITLLGGIFTLTETSIGSIQTITFTQEVNVAGESACSDLLSLPEAFISYLGNNAECSLPTNTTMIIKYGSNVKDVHSEVKIELKPEGFKPNTISGSFFRPSLPSFRLLETTKDAYQNYKGKITMSNVRLNSQSNMSFRWLYISSPVGEDPDLSEAISTFTFNYFDMNPGDYIIQISISDPDNHNYLFQTQSNKFSVLDSCSTDECQSITWKFTYSPGFCEEECVAGHNITEDKLEYHTDLTQDPYIVTAKYEVGSVGGKSLSIIPEKYGGYHNIPCGGNIRFPSLKMWKDTDEIMATDKPFIFGGALLGSVGIEYSLTWKEPPGISICKWGELNCEIGAHGIPTGGPYSFTLQLHLTCMGEAENIWTELPFTPFYYSLHPVVSSVGSVQTITFKEDIAAAGRISCQDLLSASSTLHLGHGAVCSLPNSKTLEIRYGTQLTAGDQTIHLRPAGFTGIVEAHFPRHNLPNFDIILDECKKGFQDYSGKVNLGNIHTNNQSMEFNWEYGICPENGGPKPDLSGLPHTTTSVQFNYWELSPGRYMISISMRDPNNDYFSYVEESAAFDVEKSCGGSCQTIVWTFTSDPGECVSDCAIGTMEGDELIYSSEYIASNSTYEVKGVYRRGSIGGRNLTLRTEKYEGMHNVECGALIAFPKLELNENSPDTQSSYSSLQLSGIIIPNGLGRDTEYGIKWVQPTPICSNSESCVIPPRGLDNGGPYAFTLQILLVCLEGENKIWKEINFRPFLYSPSFTITSQGSIQNIGFLGEVVPTNSGNKCEDLLSPESVNLIGESGSCLLEDSVLEIKYGRYEGNIGENRNLNMTISLRAEGYSPRTPGSFLIPPLPTFRIRGNTVGEGYQDCEGVITLGDINTNGREGMHFRWGDEDNMSHAVVDESITFKFWELEGGRYNLHVGMLDPLNALFLYLLPIAPFTVLTSCSSNGCDTITWRFTHNPGTCEVGCILGSHLVDSFTYIARGDGSKDYPYEVLATYLPGSIGGSPLTLDPAKYASLHTASCGADISFPRLSMGKQAPEVLLSSQLLTISGVVNTASVLETDYDLQWIQPFGFTGCQDHLDTCDIPPDTLHAQGGPYSFKLNVLLLCLTPTVVWDTLHFGSFHYSTTLSATSHGSVQTITFLNQVSVVEGATCPQLLLPDSLQFLGTNAACTLSAGGSKLEIKYGAHLDLTGEPPLLSLNSSAFSPHTEGSFLRTNLPKFRLHCQNVDSPKYQDNMGEFSAEDLVNNGHASMRYKWRYKLSPSHLAKQDISTRNMSSMSLNYRECSPGMYQVVLRMTDSSNALYFYEEKSPIFTILESCGGTCTEVWWRFSGNPGNCEADCVQGVREGDSVVTRTEREETTYSIYTVRVRYLPGSKGGQSLSLKPSSFNNLENTKCGEDTKFPTVRMEKEAPEIQSTTEELTLSGVRESNGLTMGIHYTETWEQPEGYPCHFLEPSSCTIPKGGLNEGGPYAFKLLLRLICQGSTAGIWSQVSFTPFYYSSAIHLTPIARITGGEGTHYPSQRVQLSGVDSTLGGDAHIDIDMGIELTYKWECFLDIPLISTHCRDKEGNILEGNEAIYTIPPHSLNIGTYYFKLTVTQLLGEGLKGSSNTTITIVSSESHKLLLEIEGGNIVDNLVNPEEDVTFHIKYLEGNVVENNNQYKWNVTGGLPIEGIVINGKYLTLLKNSMKGGNEYILLCDVTTTAEEVTRISRRIYAVEPLIGGTLKVEPTTGIAFQTLFTLSAGEFKGGRVKYRFSVMKKGINIGISREFKYGRVRMNSELPPGNEEEGYLVTVIVHAQNIYGMVRNHTTQVQVLPWEGGGSEYSADTVAGYWKGKSKEERVLILGLAAELTVWGRKRTSHSSCGECATDYGSCQYTGELATPPKCVCQEGYTTPECSLTHDRAIINTQIQREILKEIYSMLQLQLTKGEVLALLSAATLASHASFLADTQANKLTQDIQILLSDNLFKHKITTQEILSPWESREIMNLFLQLLSNILIGLEAENSEYSLETGEELGRRQKAVVGDLRELSKHIFGGVAVGVSMLPISTLYFDILCTVGTGQSLLSPLSLLNLGPKVQLNNNIADIHNSTIYTMTYINMKGNPHIDNQDIPCTHTLDYQITQFEGGTLIEGGRQNNTNNNNNNIDNSPIITITFSYSKNIKSSLECVFYDERREEYSTVGMTHVEETGDNITCGSTHFSQFTVLPLVSAIEKIDEEKTHSRHILYFIIGCVCILVFGLILVCCIIYCRKKRVIIIYIISLFYPIIYIYIIYIQAT